MSNGLIDLNEEGTCRTRMCQNIGKRARGSRDIEGFAERTGVFDKSFYCDDCLAAAAQRSLSTSMAQTRRNAARAG